MSSFLITGGAFFFSSILKKELLSKGHNCISIDLCPDNDTHENPLAFRKTFVTRTRLKNYLQEKYFDVFSLGSHACPRP